MANFPEEGKRAILEGIKVMMQKHVTNWPEPKEIGTALVLVDRTLQALMDENVALLTAMKPFADVARKGDISKCAEVDYQALLVAYDKAMGISDEPQP